MKNSLKITVAFLFGSLILIPFGLTHSQEEIFSQTAHQYKLSEEVQVGDLIVENEGQLVRAAQRYDKNLFGVVVEKAIITFGKPEDDSYPLVTSGPALVRVNADYEEIEKGDYITSSENEGIGQKATASGFVIGRALESIAEGEDLIKVMVNPHEATIDAEENWEEITLWEAVGRIFTVIERDVPEVLRYVLAIILVIGSLTFGFKSFVKALREGVAGISRNPLAKGSIRFAMILNLVGILILTLAGLGLSILVILL